MNDMQWCPFRSTVFVAAAGNTLQVWDLEQSVLRWVWVAMAATYLPTV